MCVLEQKVSVRWCNLHLLYQVTVPQSCRCLKLVQWRSQKTHIGKPDQRTSSRTFHRNITIREDKFCFHLHIFQDSLLLFRSIILLSNFVLKDATANCKRTHTDTEERWKTANHEAAEPQTDRFSSARTPAEALTSSCSWKSVRAKQQALKRLKYVCLLLHEQLLSPCLWTWHHHPITPLLDTRQTACEGDLENTESCSWQCDIYDVDGCRQPYPRISGTLTTTCQGWNQLCITCLLEFEWQSDLPPTFPTETHASDVVGQDIPALVDWRVWFVFTK